MIVVWCAGYFSGALGPGQLGMFNLLKAYSILDHEVGYCQVRPISTVHYHTLFFRLGRYYCTVLVRNLFKRQAMKVCRCIFSARYRTVGQ